MAVVFVHSGVTDPREWDDVQEPGGGVELDLSKIAVPVLVLRGELDWPDVERAAKRFVRELPDGREGVIDGVAHLPALEHPDEVARLLGEFLRPPHGGA